MLYHCNTARRVLHKIENFSSYFIEFVWINARDDHNTHRSFYHVDDDIIRVSETRNTRSRINPIFSLFRAVVEFASRAQKFNSALNRPSACFRKRFDKLKTSTLRTVLKMIVRMIMQTAARVRVLIWIFFFLSNFQLKYLRVLQNGWTAEKKKNVHDV